MGFNNKQYNRTFLGTPGLAAGTIGGTAQIFSGAGTFHGVVVGTTTATQFVVSDSVLQTGIVVTNGSTVMLLKSSVAEQTVLPDAAIANGLYVTFGINGTYTVLWSQG